MSICKDQNDPFPVEPGSSTYLVSVISKSARPRRIHLRQGILVIYVAGEWNDSSRKVGDEQARVLHCQLNLALHGIVLTSWCLIGLKLGLEPDAISRTTEISERSLNMQFRAVGGCFCCLLDLVVIELARPRDIAVIAAAFFIKQR
jgi:hypothetical protein